MQITKKIEERAEADAWAARLAAQVWNNQTAIHSAEWSVEEAELAWAEARSWEARAIAADARAKFIRAKMVKK